MLSLLDTVIRQCERDPLDLRAVRVGVDQLFKEILDFMQRMDGEYFLHITEVRRQF